RVPLLVHLDRDQPALQLCDLELELARLERELPRPLALLVTHPLSPPLLGLLHPAPVAVPHLRPRIAPVREPPRVLVRNTPELPRGDPQPLRRLFLRQLDDLLLLGPGHAKFRILWLPKS